jgi:predicted AlkP superfamily pyrophosphatase or phosphodiesterase
MTKFLFTILSFGFFAGCFSQINAGKTVSRKSTAKRPKLVVGIVIDQMRWDYLYRYNSRYSDNGGFKRLLNQGFSCQNTFIPYVPTITACGHSCIYTGSVPAINGIAGNDWWDRKQQRFIYCTQDDSTKTIGSNTTHGQMSPKNLLTTTIGDELRLATNFYGKVIGIAIKDRGAILPAGHSANGAYWYDNKTGDWITSSYYANELPAWVRQVNDKKLVDTYYAEDWHTLYPLNTYVQSGSDSTPFPRKLKQYTGKNYEMISATPYGNNFTFEMATAAINGEKLGADSVTDLLAVSLSSPDYIGHAYGPNSIEAEDCFLRLDKELGDFLNYLDHKIGKSQYLLFLTADHGAAHVPAFLKSHHMPAGNFDNEKITEQLDKFLNETFNTSGLLLGILNYEVYLDPNIISASKINSDSLHEKVIAFLLKDSAINNAFPLDALNKITLNSRTKEAIANGYFPGRSGDIQIILRPQWIDGFIKGGTTHGVWNPYDAHIPLIWFGWNIGQGKTYREVYMTDIAATIAALLDIQMPSGCVGHVIEDLTK